MVSEQVLFQDRCSGVAHKGAGPVPGPFFFFRAHRIVPCLVALPCPALPCPSRRPAGRAPPCPTRRAALLAARCPALRVAPPCWSRAALPYSSRRPAGRRAVLPCPPAALLAAAPLLPAAVRSWFETWQDDLQLYLHSESRDGVSLFDHTSWTSPPKRANSATRSLWLTRDANARLAIRNHLPPAKCVHFGQHKTTKALFDAVVTCYSSPSTAALGRLLQPYLFPELLAFATVDDLITHLRTSDTRCRAALPTKFLHKNTPPPIYITLYFIALLMALLALPSLRGVPPPPLSPLLLLLLLLTSLVLRRSGLRLLIGRGAAAARAREARVVGVAAVEAVEVAAMAVGVVVGVRASVVAVVVAVGVVAAVVAAVGVVAAAVVAVGVEPVGGEVLAVARGSTSSVRARPLCLSSYVSGLLCVGRLGGVFAAHVFALDCDAILAGMYAVTVTAEGDCYLCVPHDLGIEAAALGSSESALSGTAPTAALHTFTLDLGASR
ncbi:unnamed protein product, partial [Closterium sp. NIES-53]